MINSCISLLFNDEPGELLTFEEVFAGPIFEFLKVSQSKLLDYVSKKLVANSICVRKIISETKIPCPGMTEHYFVPLIHSDLTGSNWAFLFSWVVLCDLAYIQNEAI